jgi:hypothetical protein
MATVKLPDGRTITFPDGLAPEQVRKIVDAASGTSDPPKEPVAPDMVKSFGSGVARGSIAIPGGFGTSGQMAQDATASAVEWLGAPKSVSDFAGKGARVLMGPLAGLPSTEQLTDALEGVTGPLYEPKTTAGKYARTMGEFVPGMLLGPGSIGQRVASGIPAALGSEAAGQAFEGTRFEPIARVGGAVAGGMVPDVASRIISPFPVNAERAKNIRTLRKEGVPVTAGQATGRKGLAYMESELGGGKAAQMMEDQAEQFTRAAASKAGLTTTRLGPDVMNKALDDIGTVFDDLASRTSVRLDPRMQDDMLAAVTEYQSISGTPAAAPEQLMNTIAKLANDNGGVLDGKAYKTISSQIAKFRRGSGDPALKEALHGIKEAMDDAIERGLSPDLMDKWRAARTNYRNLLVLENAMGRAGEGVAEGLVSPSGLRGATAAVQGKRNYVTGDGDYAELARAGENLLKPLPNSGTAGRLNAQNMGVGGGAILGSVLGSGGGAPGMTMGGVAGALAGASVPYAAGRLLMTKPVQAYLANLLMKPTQQMGAAQRMAVPLMGAGPRAMELLAQELENR